MEVLYLFMMFSIVGWLWETPFVSIRTKQFVNRGFLRGPYIPIYGFAVVTIILSMSIFDSLDSSNVFVHILMMIYMGLVTAVWEFVTSYVLEKIFKTRWWDYSDHKYNLQGRISLYVTVFFGIGGYVLYMFIFPPFMSIFNAIPESTMLYLLIGFYIVFTIDEVFTLIDLFKYRDIVTKLEKAYNEFNIRFKESLADLKVDFRERTESLNDTVSELRDLYDQKFPHPVKELKETVTKLQTKVNNSNFIKRLEGKYPTRKNVSIKKVKAYLESLIKENRS